ncbi:MAG: thiamine diphosphokinase [Bacillota bacterium]
MVEETGCPALAGRRAVIISNGQVRDVSYFASFIRPSDYVIAVDGGLKQAQCLGARVDMLLGDFDSLPEEEVLQLAHAGVRVMRYPPEKDQTDTHLALEYAVRSGASEVIMLSALGGRLDHTLANLWLLPVYHSTRCPVTIVGDDNTVHLVKDEISMQGRPGEYVSLLPVTPEVRGITTSGLRYPLVNGTLRWGESLGISNEFLKEQARVTLTSGMLFVIRVNPDRYPPRSPAGPGRE